MRTKPYSGTAFCDTSAFIRWLIRKTMGEDTRDSRGEWWYGDWSVYKGTLGYGLYFDGREVWSLIHNDFLASRWFDTAQEAINHIPTAVQDLNLYIESWSDERSKEKARKALLTVPTDSAKI